MWPVCHDINPLWGLLPLLIGLITGWWAWARRGPASPDRAAPDHSRADSASGLGVADTAVLSDRATADDSDRPATLAKVSAPDRAPQAADELIAPPLPSFAPLDRGNGAAALTAIGVAPASGPADDLQKIRGIGPKLGALLNRLGVSRFDQIAPWSDEMIGRIDEHLGEFKGRIVRDEWVAQAQLLAAGDHAGWQARYGMAKAPPAAAAGAVALTAIGVPAAVGEPDNLLQIKGIGPKLNQLLTSLGITRFDQIAAWTADDIEKVDDHLGSFKNRIGRDNWVEQAGLLAHGMIAEFEAKFGKLDTENR